MDTTLPPLVIRTIERLIRNFNPQRIMLFGSYAKEKTRQGSDVDLLVIADLTGNIIFHKKRARQLSSDCFPMVDVSFATPEEIANASMARSPFLLSILQKGITLYEKKPNT
jgi:uncharacterized protein